MSDDYYECDFPEWALGYLVNGDDDNMSYDDKAEADAFLEELRQLGYDTASPDVTDDRNAFCSHPAFGLAGATTTVRFMNRKERHG